VGQKSNPIGLRLGINKTWDSRWCYKDRLFAKYLNEDLDIRKFIEKKYYEAGIAKVEIERAAKLMVVKLHAARPGKIIGKQGKEIEVLREEVKRLVSDRDFTVKVDVFEVKQPDLNSNLVAQNIAQQLEKRVSFRRAMKKAMQQSMKAGAKGIKVRVGGRLNGAEMARVEWYLDPAGRVPLHTLRADIDYGFFEARTTYGAIGVKVWIFKGEVYEKGHIPFGHNNRGSAKGNER